MTDTKKSNDNGWKVLQQMIHDDLKDLEREVSGLKVEVGAAKLETTESINDVKLELSKSINGVQIELAKLKIKAGLWGTVGASIPVGIVLIAQFWR